jgi:DNA-binding NarL/FixJ family response regulator
MPDVAGETARIGIVLAGREATARSHLTQLLANEHDMSVIAEASHLGILRQQVREHRPDVVVLGLDARRLPSLDALDGLFSESEDTRYVVMNIDHGPEQDALPDAIRLATSRERTRRRSC